MRRALKFTDETALQQSSAPSNDDAKWDDGASLEIRPIDVHEDNHCTAGSRSDVSTLKPPVVNHRLIMYQST